MAQSFQNDNAMELMPIIQLEYNTQTSNTANNIALLYNVSVTNNAQTISPNNLKRISPWQQRVKKVQKLTIKI